MKRLRGVYGLGSQSLLFLALACAAGVAFGWQGQNPQGSGATDQLPPLIHSLSGAQLFRAYCASCHGIDGKGDGPAAAALKAKVPDLTLLSMNHRGEFPAARVRQMIVGEDAVAAHGSREMPVWGPVFHQIEADVDRGHVRVQNLVDYLQSIQAMPSGQLAESAAAGAPAKIASGARLYQQLCASCHANDLKGNGPAPYPFKDVPPDLTTLAKRHGGVFPDAYVSNVLRNGVALPAHGPAEMPIWGADFRASNGLSRVEVTQRIGDLSSYLKSRQGK